MNATFGVRRLTFDARDKNMRIGNRNADTRRL